VKPNVGSNGNGTNPEAVRGFSLSNKSEGDETGSARCSTTRTYHQYSRRKTASNFPSHTSQTLRSEGFVPFVDIHAETSVTLNCQQRKFMGRRLDCYRTTWRGPS